MNVFPTCKMFTLCSFISDVLPHGVRNISGKPDEFTHNIRQNASFCANPQGFVVDYLYANSEDKIPC